MGPVLITSSSDIDLFVLLPQGQLNIGRAVYAAAGKCYPPDGGC